MESEFKKFKYIFFKKPKTIVKIARKIYYLLYSIPSDYYLVEKKDK
jgi:hypothetical protein